MLEEVLVKKLSIKNIEQELCSVGFDKNYLQLVTKKYKSGLYKIFDLTPEQATILKQTALSCGTDCAIHREVLTHNIDYTDAILFATNAQLIEIIKKLSIQPFGLKNLATKLENINNNIKQFSIRNVNFDWKKTYIMGILNCTPNSFSDGGEFFNTEDALSRFETIISQGADIVDIGAESTAPNNESISAEEEVTRLEKILKKCREANQNIPISIDTRNAKTAKYALDLGIDIVNDVSGFSYDNKMAEVVANSNAYVVLTFDDEIQNNTLDETIKGLTNKVKKAISCGVNREKIILDVGLGFNKTYEQNFELIKQANEVCSLGLPVLYGLSRKSFVQKVTNLSPKETLAANISLASYLASKGVHILRVHDVLEHKIAFQGLDKVLYD